MNARDNGREMKSQLLSFALLILAAFAGITWKTFHNPVQGLLREESSTQILAHIRELKAPLVVVNFWASWCEPCKIEFPHLLSLKQNYSNQGLKVVFISMDDYSDLPAAEKFLKDNNVDFPTFFKGAQPLKFVTEIFPKWSGAIPATVLFGPKGDIVDAWEGDTSLEEFEAKIKPHLRGT